MEPNELADHADETVGIGTQPDGISTMSRPPMFRLLQGMKRTCVLPFAAESMKVRRGKGSLRAKGAVSFAKRRPLPAQCGYRRFLRMRCRNLTDHCPPPSIENASGSVLHFRIGGAEDVVGVAEGSIVMPVETLPALRPSRAPWNKGRIVGHKLLLLPKHVWFLRERLEMADNRRDLALFNRTVDSKLRGCDLVGLRVNDVYAAGHVKERASVTQSKTRKPVRFEITETTRLALERWTKDPERVGSEYLWPSRVPASPHLSTRQYARIMRDWVLSVGLEPGACRPEMSLRATLRLPFTEMSPEATS